MSDPAGKSPLSVQALARAKARAKGLRGSNKNSPSRLRFRPLLPLAFRFRVQPSGEVSTYLRSVLGADGNLEGLHRPIKTRQKEVVAICENFNFPHFHSHSSNLCRTLWRTSGRGRAAY
jgi:hypothetical protein